MAETYTPPTPETPSRDPFTDIEQMQAAQSARRIFEQSEVPQTTVTETKESPSKVNRVLAGTVVTAAALGGGYAAYEALDTPDFSEQSTTYTVQPGDGLYDAANDIIGINTVDTRDAVDHIQADPANIDVLKDGLQPGEQITIPISVAGHEPTDQQ